MHLLLISLVVIVLPYVLPTSETLSSFCTPLYLKITNNQHYNKLKELKVKRNKVYIEKTSISPQDQYARWTKLNRSHDQLTREIGEVEAQISELSSRIQSSLALLLRIMSFLPLILRFWYRKNAVFAIDNAYTSDYETHFNQIRLPNLLVYLLSFPSCTAGAVCLGQWLFFVNTFITGVTFIVKNIKPSTTPNVEETESTSSTTKKE